MEYSMQYSAVFGESDCAEYYRKYRPRWPKEIIEAILTETVKKNVFQSSSVALQLAVDIGCGTGQSTLPLAPYFTKVIGLDVSESQLDNARKDDNPANVEYRYGSANDIPLPDKCVDLITGCNVLHWIHTEAFCKEIDRVLKPGGWFAFYAPQKNIGIESEEKTKSEQLCNEFMGLLGILYQDEDIKLYEATLTQPFFEPVNQYQQIKSTRDFTAHRQETNVCGLIGYLKSTSGYWPYLNKFPLEPDPLEEFQKRIMSITNVDKPPEQIPLTLIRRLWLRRGRKPE